MHLMWNENILSVVTSNSTTFSVPSKVLSIQREIKRFRFLTIELIL